jgi:hypothetical protein
MICYKAIERFFENGKTEREHLCGFGYCRDLKDAQKTYRSGIIISEISEDELKELFKKKSTRKRHQFFELSSRD